MKVFILDLDGVVYLNGEVIPGAPGAIRMLQNSGSVYFLTNDATRHRRAYVARLAKLGVETDVAHMMNSGYGAAIYIAKRAPGGSVFPVGEEGLCEELEEQGLEVHTLENPPGANAVVVAKDRHFNFPKLSRAYHEIVEYGAEFIAANKDPTFPLPGGRVEPGGGTMVAAVEYAVGRPAFLIGKPNTYLFELVFGAAQCAPGDAVMIGDRLDTDIEGGKRAGAKTALVLTGISHDGDAAKAPAEQRPDFVFKNLPDAVEDLL